MADKANSEIARELDLDAIRKRCEKAIPGPWFIAHDDATDSPDHKHSGLALVETGRSADWWVARLCEWPTADFITNSITDIPALLAEIDRLRAKDEAVATALVEAKDKIWGDAIEVVESTWATTSVGKVSIENQSEYERNRVIAALTAARSKKAEADSHG